MKGRMNSTDAKIVQGNRFDGDDSWWVVEEGCEDVGPFESHEEAADWFRDYIGTQGGDHAEV